MAAPKLVRSTSNGVTLLGDQERPGGVTLAFTERTGGVSVGEFASLNLHDSCGDKPAAVAENRRRALAALGAEHLYESLVNPKQVHGDHVVTIGGGGVSAAEARELVRLGADAVVCTEPGVPVLLCFADCVPVILAAPSGFAVVHSGWRGTKARIVAKALRALVGATESSVDDVRAYVGPHIGVEDYQVSAELAAEFVGAFGVGVAQGDHLDLGEAVLRTLEGQGVVRDAIVVVEESTASHTDRFFSYRAESGSCGRHGALAYL